MTMQTAYTTTEFVVNRGLIHPFLAFSRACKTHTPLTNQRKRQENNLRVGFRGRTLRMASLG